MSKFIPNKGHGKIKIEKPLIDDATFQNLTARLAILGLISDSLVAEIDDLIQYKDCIKLRADGKATGFKMPIDGSFAVAFKRFAKVVNGLNNKILGDNDKTDLEFFDNSKYFDRFHEELVGMWTEATMKRQESLKEKIKDAKVCNSCGKMHAPKDSIIEYNHFGTCDVCGSEDLPLTEAKNLDYLGFKVD
tara:strand:+ start:229 stop:798 length:570 start_codon:yes stop_codon:yes gene_type:complete